MASELQPIFLSFCAVGDRGGGGQMDGAKFAKLARDCKILDSKVTPTDVDITFAKVKPKGGRKISFAQFMDAMGKLAAIKYRGMPADEAMAALTEHVVKAGGPKAKGTKAKTGGVYSKLTDTSQYTGAHKERFDSSGHGRGLEGRVDHDKCEDLSEITRPGLRGPLHARVSAVGAGGGGDIDALMAAAHEREALARSAFTKFDSDGSGYLDHTELANLLKELHFDDADVDAEFKEADKSGDGKIDFSEFVIFFNNLQGRAYATVTGSAPAPRAAPVRRVARTAGSAKPTRSSASGSAGAGSGGGGSGGGSLKDIYLSFCRFGGATFETEMDNVKFAKFARDCGLVSKKCTRTDIDLIFTQVKVKGSRKLQYSQFETALEKIGAKLFPGTSPAEGQAKVAELVLAHAGPSSSGTVADTSGVYAKMVDSSQYTGMHKGKP